jgi:iron complex outermembrane receptor protein
MRSRLLSTAAFVVLALPAAVHAQTAPAPLATDVASSAAAPTADTEQVIVTGTRQTGRTKLNSDAPVDTISGAELQKTGEQNIFDALNKLVPSFEIPGEGFDTAGLVRSARLRGLSPDDTLVLINGKRRHISANINADVGPVGGSDPTDLDLIPISLIDHIEVLRDGAAAQYGSDAVAGVINIILKKSTSGGSAYAQEGADYPSDGFTNDLGANYALPLFDKGFLDLAANYRYHDHTNRTGFDSRAGEFGLTENPGRIIGDPKYNLASVGYNAGYDVLPDDVMQIYSNGTYANRAASAFENWRPPTKLPEVYPGGFVPREAIYENDYGFTGGVKGTVLGGWGYDLSSTYGADIINLKNKDSANVDFYNAFGYTPNTFHTGEFNDSQWTNNLDFTKSLDYGIFAKPIDVAFGGEYRRDTYQLEPGDFASQYGGGSQAYPGFLTGAASNSHRQNEAGYIDVATDILPGWNVDVAGRFEHYSDVGNTKTFKVSSRYDFTPQYAIRGTINNGFRAPTLAQENFEAVNVSPSAFSGQLPVNSPVAKFLGAVPLQAEQSINYSVGFVAEPIPKLHFAVDAYQISIHNQIVDSGTFGGNVDTPAGQQLIALLRAAGFGIDEGLQKVTGQYYTNGINTRTRGVDGTADYSYTFDEKSKLDLTVAVNFNDVELTRLATLAGGAPEFTPDVLSEYTRNSPKNKLVLQAYYTYDKASLLVRETRWGSSLEVFPDNVFFGPNYYPAKIAPTWITDIEIGYKIYDGVKLSVGADNVFNLYPNPTPPITRYVNSTVYNASSPFGFDGGFYYARINYTFGGKDNSLPEPLPAVAPPPPPVAVEPVRTYLVFFDWDRADLTERARQIVQAAAVASTHVQTTQIEVNGYTDLSGTVAYNKKLSIRRAESVETELVRDGVAKSEISIHGYGESHPLVPTAPGVREPQNRRVEIILK